MKTLEKYASGMAPQKKSFDWVSFHFLDCLWACEEGLWRYHQESHIDSFMFQDPQSQRDNGVYTMIAIDTRCHLCKDVTKNEKDAFSSKYLCIAYATKMASHWGVNFF